MDYKVEIADTTYYKSDISSVVIKRPLFDKLSVGNACSAELDISIWPISTIPKMAKLVPWVREDGASSWTKLGEFYIYTRETTDDLMHIVAYDTMMRAEQVWIPRQDLEFPETGLPMTDAVTEIARLMNIGIDSRTSLNSSYTIDYPANDYTLRDVLGYIAAANSGNWIITASGQLLLVPLFSSMPVETSYLVDERGNSITFGGVRVII